MKGIAIQNEIDFQGQIDFDQYLQKIIETGELSSILSSSHLLSIKNPEERAYVIREIIYNVPIPPKSWIKSCLEIGMTIDDITDIIKFKIEKSPLESDHRTDNFIHYFIKNGEVHQNAGLYEVSKNSAEQSTRNVTERMRKNMNSALMLEKILDRVVFPIKIVEKEEVEITPWSLFLANEDFIEIMKSCAQKASKFFINNYSLLKNRLTPKEVSLLTREALNSLQTLDGLEAQHLIEVIAFTLHKIPAEEQSLCFEELVPVLNAMPLYYICCLLHPFNFAQAKKYLEQRLGSVDAFLEIVQVEDKYDKRVKQMRTRFQVQDPGAKSLLYIIRDDTFQQNAQVKIGDIVLIRRKEGMTVIPHRLIFITVKVIKPVCIQQIF